MAPRRIAPGQDGDRGGGCAPGAGGSRLPDFLIIGAQKSGTSWLRDVLGQHPEVYVHPKELHYFDKEDRYALGPAWYREQFGGASGARAVGEKTPDYLWAGGEGAEGHRAEVHRSIHELLPGARLIVLLREPVARAVSALKHLIRTYRVSPLHGFDELLFGGKRHLVQAHGVLSKGRYHEQLIAYLELFDRGSVLVLFFEEDVIERPAEGLARTCSFLGVDPAIQFARLREKRNEGRLSRGRLAIDYHLPFLRPVTRRLQGLFPLTDLRPSGSVVDALADYYAAENDRLAALLGRALPGCWRLGESREAGR